MVWHGGECDAQSLEGKMALKIGKNWVEIGARFSCGNFYNVV